MSDLPSSSSVCVSPNLEANPWVVRSINSWTWTNLRWNEREWAYPNGSPFNLSFLGTNADGYQEDLVNLQGESGSLGVTLKDDVPSGRYQVNLSYSYLEDPANERSREYVSVDVAQSSYVQEFAETVEADVSHYWNYHPDSEFGSTKGKFSTNPPERRKGERI